jgi:hypothetical protein
MDWSGALAILNELKMPSGYVLAQLRAEDVSAVIAGLLDWYPDLEVSGESSHLTVSFYHQETLLAETSGDRSILPIVAKHGGSVVAIITFEKDVVARTVTCRIGTIAPEHRGAALALLGPMLLERVGRAVGAELVYYFATLKSLHQQVLAERAHYALVGIVPAFDRNYVHPGQIKRVYEAIYAKVLVSEDEVALPTDANLTLRTKAVWRALFERKT